MGYHRVGFEVVGVDIKPQPNYPFEFHQDDALEFVRRYWGLFEAVHASPPCQKYSMLKTLQDVSKYPDLIGPTREYLQEKSLLYVIENVVGSPLIDPVILCGSMFGLGVAELQLRRHRLFETNFPLPQPECKHSGKTIAVYGGGPTKKERKSGGGRPYKGTISEKKEAMGIDWMITKEINQAVPPAYTEYIGQYLLDYLGVKREGNSLGNHH